MKHLQQASVLFSSSKKLLYALIIVALCTFGVKAQTGTVGIGTTTPNQKAILDILSTTKGLLIPRMTSGQRTGIGATSPNEDGMIIFNTDTDNFEFFNNGQWIAIGIGSGNPGGTNTILNGTGNPGAQQGNNGDFYINTASVQIFGPKTAGAWGTGTSLIGAGGSGGGTLLTGTDNPGASTGNIGDSYINITTNQIFGPKTDQGWPPTGVQLATGPQGPPGPIGSAGPQGLAGATGATGPTGNNGTSVKIIGSVDKKENLPTPNAQNGIQVSDGYLAEDTGRLHVWTGTLWADVGVIRGPQGIQGIKGNDGTSVEIKGSVPTSANLPTPNAQNGIQVSDGYIAENTGRLHVWTGTLWADVGLVRGPEGPAGATGAQGPQGPKGNDGTSVRIIGSVSKSANLPTPDAQNGIQISDGYLAENTGHLHVWTGVATGWVDVGEIRGPQGLAGPVGLTGPKGGDGTSVVIKGSVTTEANLATIVNKTISDGYLAEDNGHLYVWTGTSWTDAGEIRGPKGADGTSVKIIGSVNKKENLPTPNAQNNIQISDGYLAEDDGHLHVWTGTSWTDVGEIRGPQGLQGPQGIPGNTVRNGTVAPDVNTPGVDGDFYINTTLSQIYGPRTAGAWGNPTQLGAGSNSATADLFTGPITVTATRGFGRYLTGEVIDATGKTAREVIEDAIKVERQIPPFTAPTIGINNNDGTAPSEYEIGTPVIIALKSEFLQNDGGNPGNFIFNKIVNGISTSLGGNSDAAANPLTEEISYTVSVTYAAGTATKTDNLGGIVNNTIPGNTITSVPITFKPFTKRYWGRSAVNELAITSTIITAVDGGLTDKVASKAKTGFEILPNGSNYLYYAYPASLGDIKDNTITLGVVNVIFKKTQVTVTNSNGIAILYNVYVSPFPYSGPSGNITIIN